MNELLDDIDGARVRGLAVRVVLIGRDGDSEEETSYLTIPVTFDLTLISPAPTCEAPLPSCRDDDVSVGDIVGDMEGV
jgi:hypothetical protein